MSGQKKVLLIAVMLIVAAAIMVWFIDYNKKLNNEKAKNQPQTRDTLDLTPFPVATDINKNTLPKNMPSDLPIEQGVVITQNNEIAVKIGEQSTRAYLSNRTLAQVFTAYKDYLQKNNWQIDATVDQADLKGFSASKDKDVMVVNISRGSTGQTAVSVILTRQK